MILQKRKLFIRIHWRKSFKMHRLMPNRFSHLDCHPVLPFWSSYAYKRSAPIGKMRRSTVGIVCVKLIIFKCHTFDKLWLHTRTMIWKYFLNHLLSGHDFMLSWLRGLHNGWKKVIRGFDWAWQDHGADLNRYWYVAGCILVTSR